jgi:predicted ester cyclase
MSLKDLYLETLRLSDAREHEAFLDRFTDDVSWIVPGAQLTGRAEVAGWLRPFWSAFSSYRHEITRVVEAGDTVVAEGTFVGVHDGPMPTPMGELPPTNREVRFDFAMIAAGDPAAARASSVRIYFDQLEFLAQVGALPSPDVAAA